MVFEVNEPQVKNELLKKGRVYLLRSKPQRGKEKLTEGVEDLAYDNIKAARGKISFKFLKKIKDDAELIEYICQSGFKSLDEWLRSARKSRNLYIVKLIL